jgi:hypothetical protein
MKVALAKAGAAFIFCSELAGHFGTFGRRKTFLATIKWQNLINWLLRFYDGDSGEIRIDGQNIAKVMQDSLRSAIGRAPVSRRDRRHTGVLPLAAGAGHIAAKNRIFG